MAFAAERAVRPDLALAWFLCSYTDVGVTSVAHTVKSGYARAGASILEHKRLLTSLRQLGFLCCFHRLNLDSYGSFALEQRSDSATKGLQDRAALGRTFGVYSRKEYA